MSEVSRIAGQLHRAYAGPAWHGPALTEILSGVTAASASQHPVAGAHSIWEIVVHIAVWMGVAADRALGHGAAVLPPNQDWPAVIDIGESAWQHTLESLAAAQQRLEALIGGLSDSRLKDIVPGDQPQSIYVLLHGVVQHNLYHGGQIALLKKALG